VPAVVKVTESLAPLARALSQVGPEAGTELDVVVWLNPSALVQTTFAPTLTVAVAGLKAVFCRHTWVLLGVQVVAGPVPYFTQATDVTSTPSIARRTVRIAPPGPYVRLIGTLILQPAGG
jgi:hypothetical protein